MSASQPPQDPIRLMRDALTTPPPSEESIASQRKVGRYLLHNHLQSGGMGMVFRGWDTQLKRWVALKFLKQLEERSLAMFEREAQLAAGLDHPNIAKMYEVGDHSGVPFIAMQFIDGAALSTAQRDMDLERKMDVLRQTAEAVRFAHGQRVIHRDLKPANVMLDKEGQVFVMDFGLAKEIEVHGETVTQSGMVAGTPSYMAPEQARGKADHQSDVYSLGAILYELITGRPPFVGQSATDVILQLVHNEPIWPRRLSPGLSADVEAIILHALEKETHRRYQNASELIEDLEAYRRAEPLKHARKPTVAYVLGKKIRKQPLLWGTATGLILAVVIFSALAIVGVATYLRDMRTEQEKTAAEKQDAVQARSIAETQSDLAKRFIINQLQLFLRLCAIAGKIAVAEDAQEATKAQALLNSRESLITSPEIDVAIVEIGRMLTEWRKGTRPEPGMQARTAIKLSVASREAWERVTKTALGNGGRDLGAIVLALERKYIVGDLVRRAKGVAEDLRREDDQKAARKEFFKLFWGDLCFIETKRLHGEKFEKAMVHIRDFLERENPDTRSQQFDALLRELDEASRQVLAQK